MILSSKYIIDYLEEDNYNGFLFTYKYYNY